MSIESLKKRILQAIFLVVPLLIYAEIDPFNPVVPVNTQQNPEITPYLEQAPNYTPYVVPDAVPVYPPTTIVPTVVQPSTIPATTVIPVTTQPAPQPTEVSPTLRVAVPRSQVVTPTYVVVTNNDDNIAARVRTVLNTDPSLMMSSRVVQVRVVNGTVILSGMVDSAAESSKVAFVVGQVGGVRSVTNRLTPRAY